jgi:hypothetical protein
MRAVSRELAFEQAEGVDRERLRGDGGVSLEEIRDFARAAAFPAGEGDMRVEGAAFGLQPDGESGARGLRGERGQRSPGVDPGP